MGAIPIISAGVGIVGTVSQISAQSRQSRRNNAAIAAQQAASIEAEGTRLEDIRTQREFLLENYKLDMMQRRQAWQEQDFQLRTNQLQNQIQNTQIVSALTTNEQNTANQLSQAENEIRNRALGRQSEGAAARYQAGAESAQRNTQADMSQVTDQLRQSNRELDALPRGDRLSTTDRTQRRVLQTPQIVQQIRSLQESNSLSESAARDILLSDDFNALMQQVAQFEQDSASQTINRQRAAARDDRNFGLQSAEVGYRTTADQLGRARRLLPTQARVGELQSQLNFLMQNNAIGSRANLVTSQGMAERAALESQRTSSGGLLNNIAAIGSAALPAIGAIMQMRSQQQQQIQPISITPQVVTGTLNTVNAGLGIGSNFTNQMLNRPLVDSNINTFRNNA